MSRHDNWGFFWEDAERLSTRGQKKEVQRPLPEIPNTGWRPPAEFPSLAAAKRIAVDLETYDPDLEEQGSGVRRDGYIVGVAIGVEDGGRWYYPMRHSVGAEYNFDPDVVMRWLKDELSRPHQDKVGANLMYDYDYLTAEGIPVAGKLLDVQIAEPLIDEEAMTYQLSALARKYLGESKVDEQLYRWSHAAYGGPEGRKQARNIYRCPPQLVGPYAEGDVDLPLRILAEQEKIIEREDLSRVWSVETRLLPLLIRMRAQGVRVDIERAGRVHEDLSEEIKVLQQQVKIDVYSRDDLERYCKKNQIPYLKTAAGNASFTADWLAASTNPALQKVVHLRRLFKARDVFVKSYIIDKHVNGRLHCQFNPLRSDDSGAVSGRFSSSHPNLQNIPNRDKRIGPLIRSLFIPDDDESWWVRFDQSQIEFRFLTHYGSGPGASHTRNLYRENPKVDFHRMVAELTQMERDPAKNINFGLVYGMSERTMAESMGRPLEDVQPMFQQYHERLPFIKHTYDAVSRVAATRGYIVTALGRRRRFNAYESRINGKTRIFPSLDEALSAKGSAPRRAMTHKALNALLQGGAADQIKVSMVEGMEQGVYDEFGYPSLTVHDELDFSIKKVNKDRAIEEVKRIMETSLPLRVPVITEAGYGENWAKAK